MKKISNRFYLYFLLVSVVIAGGLSFYASSSPDGLEKIAEDKGFLETAKDSAVADSPLSDYGVAGVDHDRLSVGLSGVIGVFVTALVAFSVFALAKRMRKGTSN